MATLSSGRLMAMLALTCASPDAGIGHGTARPMPATKARGIWALATTWSIARSPRQSPQRQRWEAGTLALASRLPSSSNRPSLTEVPHVNADVVLLRFHVGSPPFSFKHCLYGTAPQAKTCQKGQVCFGRFYLGKREWSLNRSRKTFPKYKGAGRRRLPAPVKGTVLSVGPHAHRGDNAD